MATSWTGGTGAGTRYSLSTRGRSSSKKSGPEPNFSSASGGTAYVPPPGSVGAIIAPVVSGGGGGFAQFAKTTTAPSTQRPAPLSSSGAGYSSIRGASMVAPTVGVSSPARTTAITPTSYVLGPRERERLGMYARQYYASEADARQSYRAFQQQRRQEAMFERQQRTTDIFRAADLRNVPVVGERFEGAPFGDYFLGLRGDTWNARAGRQLFAAPALATVGTADAARIAAGNVIAAGDAFRVGKGRAVGSSFVSAGKNTVLSFNPLKPEGAVNLGLAAFGARNVFTGKAPASSTLSANVRTTPTAGGSRGSLTGFLERGGTRTAVSRSFTVVDSIRTSAGRGVREFFTGKAETRTGNVAGSETSSGFRTGNAPGGFTGGSGGQPQTQGFFSRAVANFREGRQGVKSSTTVNFVSERAFTGTTTTRGPLGLYSSVREFAGRIGEPRGGSSRVLVSYAPESYSFFGRDSPIGGAARNLIPAGRRGQLAFGGSESIFRPNDIGTGGTGGSGSLGTPRYSPRPSPAPGGPGPAIINEVVGAGRSPTVGGVFLPPSVGRPSAPGAARGPPSVQYSRGFFSSQPRPASWGVPASFPFSRAVPASFGAPQVLFTPNAGSAPKTGTTEVPIPGTGSGSDSRTGSLYRSLIVTRAGPSVAPPDVNIFVPPSPVVPVGGGALPFGGGGGGKKPFFGAPVSFKGDYSPSLVAEVFNIRGNRKSAMRAARTGISIRPIVG